MKRITIIFLFTICILAIGSWSYAQCKGCGHGCAKCASSSDNAHGENYVDNDGDGICDNAGSQAKCKCNGEGHKCRAKNAAGNDSQKGPGYVDEDGNEKCDNLEKNQDKTE